MLKSVKNEVTSREPHVKTGLPASELPLLNKEPQGESHLVAQCTSGVVKHPEWEPDVQDITCPFVYCIRES